MSNIRLANVKNMNAKKGKPIAAIFANQSVSKTDATASGYVVRP